MEEETHRPTPSILDPPVACSPSPLPALAGWLVRLDGRWRRCWCEAPQDLEMGATTPWLCNIFFLLSQIEVSTRMCSCVLVSMILSSRSMRSATPPCPSPRRRWPRGSMVLYETSRSAH
ncbi:hypothetical protein PVAP13_3NG231352 [Panicum virgatum]|uniref:Uncharacterized protein n=1 Tax=Panicum virgatum TaxID=38727 RepID=A0A8T0UJS2_PANVG|nr:hypothetical protein PVAP13_3NG231352 [Panicum virgatum]